MLAFLAAGVWRPVAARAEPGADPIAFIRQVGGEMPGLLANTKTIEDRRAKLLPFVTRVVDLNAIAIYCMGHYWSHATPRQQQEIQALFLSVVVNTIATWTGEKHSFGNNASVVVEPPEQHDGETSVPTLVEAAGVPPVQITWVVNMQEKPARILDVAAGGISVRKMERSDFVSYLNHHDGDIDGLIELLRRRARDTGGVLAQTGLPR
jgi:phospholipid transport system substrate-binding protein